MKTTLLSAVALLCASTGSFASQHRNSDGSISDDVLIQSNGLVIGPLNPLPVGQPDLRGTGAIAAATLNATYALALANGQGVVAFTLSGLTGSGATLVPEISNDGGTSWSPVNAIGPSGISQALIANQQVRVNAGGHTNVRLRVSIIGTGTITVASNISMADSLVIDPNNAAFGGETPVTVGGTPAFVGRSFKAICTTAGTITYTYSDGSTGSWGLGVGTQTLPIALASLTSAGSASCSYANLR